MSTPLVAFSDLRTAAYCPRAYYYRRRERADSPAAVPTEVSRVRALATRYRDLLTCPLEALADEPIALEPRAYRRALEETRGRFEEHGEWERLCEPRECDRLVTGRECRGVIQKVLEGPLAPSLVSAGRPPERGVYATQTVHAVAAAKALAWETKTPIEIAYLEYPAYGVIRRVPLTTRRKAQYRRTLRTVRAVDGPPPRLGDTAKCRACEYAETCGVRTRTLRSLLER
ncbi:CRISPR-associated protein Cas4 [Natronobiforma cellulositropha]|uniref:CRISPR-associated protein Cas4 n=1 Tax=Natronobiforma cellulositropha TaxID=1679076 RepID=UPI0021D5A86C|nr:hypothetical protein [Natronobiforma cellulositropha]